ncbi:hypothetical protein G4B88_003499 [Cannabis sativa]|uniref:Myosin motor domain-containing protein n=1 Tax=Cannabis sativa TaxID=3483 RepID=A0A7J6GTL8_CANSA|nr:hypothetical protein G4B88_003499 [Cannabis sativa]
MGARRNGDVAFSPFCSFSSSNNTRLGKHVHDNVHGNIYLDPLVLKFIDTEEFQRQVLVAPINGKWLNGVSFIVLRDLKQLVFENSNILQQLWLHYVHNGVMEAIRIICAGYPTRKPFREFVGRFGILDPNVFAGSCDEVTACKRLLEKVDLNSRIGKTKVFLRAGQMAELNACRSEVLGRSASVIQRKVIDKFFAAQSMASLVCNGIKGINLAIANSGLRDLLNSARLDNSSSNIKKSRFFIVNPTHLNQKYTLESGLIKYFQPELPNKSGSTRVSPNDLAYGMLPQGLRLSGTYTDIIVPPSSNIVYDQLSCLRGRTHAS